MGVRSVNHRSVVAILFGMRRSLGLTQAQLAKRLKRSQTYVARIETHQRRVDVAEFIEFARALKVDPVRLFKSVAEWND